MNIEKGNIDTKEKRSYYTVCVVGCGRKGLTYACLFADAGFKVIAADKNPQIVSIMKTGKRAFHEKNLNQILRKHVKDGRIIATTEVKEACAKSNIITMFVPIKIDEKEKPDYSCLEKACKDVGMGLQKGSLIIVMTTVTPGTTERLIKETLETSSGLKAGKDFGLGYAQLSIPPGMVAGIDKNSSQVAAMILETITDNPIIMVEDLKVAESAQLFSLIQNHVKTTLASEFSVFCDKIGVDYVEVQKVLNKGYSVLTFPQVSRLNSKLVHVFLNEAEALNLKMRITSSAKETAEEILNYAIRLVKKALRKCGKPLRRSRITILGVSGTPDTKDEKNPFVKKLMKKLISKGVQVRVYDPFFAQKELNEMGYPAEKTLKQAVENTDCIIITVPHERFGKMNLRRLSLTAKMPAAMVDLAYIINPEKAKKEGFAFLGLGRG